MQLILEALDATEDRGVFHFEIDKDLEAVCTFFSSSDRLPQLPRHATHCVDKEELRCAHILDDIRRARMGPVERYDKKQKQYVVVQPRLRNWQTQKWEKELGRHIWDDPRSTESYLPSSAIHHEDHRATFPRTPYCCKPIVCYLCGQDFHSKQQLLQEHFAEKHLQDTAGTSFSLQRLEEEYRKLVAFFEERDGPFVVSGQEFRRSVSAHARHQTHSYAGRPEQQRLNFDSELKSGKPRTRGSCTICARSRWLEDLIDYDLFVQPARQVQECDMQECGEDPCHDSDVESCSDLDDDADVSSEDEMQRQQFSKPVSKHECTTMKHQVQPEAVEQVHKSLDMRVYAERWPLIPQQELAASTVCHPYGKYADGSPWRWLLDTKAIPKASHGHSGLNPDGTLQTDNAGNFPKVPVCRSCAHDLQTNRPKMPLNALANDNMMLREPTCFRRNKEGKQAKLSPMTFTVLALARMVVQKIIAEPAKKADPATKQKGLRANTICFPQAVIRELVTEALPAEPDISRKYLADAISIALVGAAHQDLDKADWTEIPREAYMTAVRFFVAHSPAYQHLHIDEEQAQRRFAELGKSCAEVLQQATVLPESGPTNLKMDGPATFDAPDIVCEEAVLNEEHHIQELGNADMKTANPTARAALDPDSEIFNELNLHITADNTNASDLDMDRAVKELAFKIEALEQQLQKDAFADDTYTRLYDIQTALKHVTSEDFQSRFQTLCQQIAEAESDHPLPAGAQAPGFKVHTARKPLSMYDKELWQKAFPDLFPYGDGVFGIIRRRHMSFPQWAAYMLQRTELHYDVQKCRGGGVQPCSCPLLARGLSPCSQCAIESDTFVPPSQPRWKSNLTFLSAIYDVWRRMEIVRRASFHVCRKQFQTDVHTVCQSKAADIVLAFQELGPKAGFRELLRSETVADPLKAAVRNLLIFSSDVVGSDGSRQQLRHQQFGNMLRFGGISAFLTPNIADTRNPLVVLLHADVLNNTDGGLDVSGDMERYTISLLDEAPVMPHQEEMLKVIANDPVAQAEFFLLSLRLFCEHVLGIGPMDEYLRHNASADGVKHPDGYAASFMGGCFNMIAALHGPIEEQARLSCHPHIVMHYINRTSQAWLRSILLKDSPKAIQSLKVWQQKVIAAAEALQCTCVGTAPLHFVDNLEDALPLTSMPYPEKWRKEDKFDGQLEQDRKYPELRRVNVPPARPFVDYHIRSKMPSPYVDTTVGEQQLDAEGDVQMCTSVAEQNPEDVQKYKSGPENAAHDAPSGCPDTTLTGQMLETADDARMDIDIAELSSNVVQTNRLTSEHAMNDVQTCRGELESTNVSPSRVNLRKVPLTGAVMSTMPHYRIMPEEHPSCSCAACSARNKAYCEYSNANLVLASDEAKSYVRKFCEDLHALCSLSGHLHQHHDTCFKYVQEGEKCKPQHCRFGFVHFVHLWLPKSTDSYALTDAKEYLVQKILARVGKEPVLPRRAEEPPPDLFAKPIVLHKDLFRPASLGASVETDDRQAQCGRIKTVRFNPREGSTNIGAMVAHRGNLDYQDCRRTFTDGYEQKAPPTTSSGICMEKVPFTESLKHASATLLKFLCKDGLNQCKASPLARNRILKQISATLAQYLKQKSQDHAAFLNVARRFHGRVVPRKGAADCTRIGERDPTMAQLTGKIKTIVIESIRSGVQTSFYICDYSTKPNMVCAPLLQNLATGMQALELELEESKNTRKLQELDSKHLLSGNGGHTDVTSKAERQRDEARRRLIRCILVDVTKTSQLPTSRFAFGYLALL